MNIPSTGLMRRMRLHSFAFTSESYLFYPYRWKRGIIFPLQHLKSIHNGKSRNEDVSSKLQWRTHQSVDSASSPIAMGNRDQMTKQNPALRKMFSTDRMENSGLSKHRLPHERRLTSSKTSSVENPRHNRLNQLVFQLQMDIRRLKRVHLSDIQAILSLLENYTKLEEHSQFVLSCCGSLLPDVKIENRNKLVDSLWNVIIKNANGNPGIESFETVLKVHSENSHPTADPFLIIQQIKSVGLKPSEHIYHHSLMLYCQRGNSEASVKLLNIMKADNVPIAVKHFNCLVLGNARAGDINGAKEILSIMKSSGLDPSAETYTILMQILIEGGQLEELKNTFGLVKDKHIFPDESFLKLLKAAAVSKSEPLLDCVLDWIAHSQMNYLTLINTIKEIIYCGETLAALKIVEKFSNTLKGKDDAVPVGSFFIWDSILADEDPTIVVSVCGRLLDEGVNEFAFNIATHCSFRQKKFDLAMSLLEEMSRRSLEIRSHYFLPLIVHQYQCVGIEGLVAVIEKMKALNVPMDWTTSYDFVIPRLLSTDVTDGGISALEAARVLKVSSNITYSSGILSGILAYLLKQKRIREASILVQKAKGTLRKPELIVVNLAKAVLFEPSNLEESLMLSIVILQYMKDNVPSNDKTDYIGSFLDRISESLEGQPELWKQFLKGLEKANITVSEGVLQNMQSSSKERVHLKIDPDLNENDSVGGRGWPNTYTHPRDMDIAGLECHVEELTSKSMNTRGALRKLFLKYCQQDDLQKALDIKAKFEINSASISDGMKAALMGLYIRNKLPEQARSIYKDLQESSKKSVDNVHIDFYKIIDLASLLLENNLIDEAVSLVERDCLDCPPPFNPKTVTRNVVRFLEALAKAECDNKLTAKPTKLKPIVDLLLDKSMAESNGPVIGVLIRTYIERRNIERAVAEFKFYSLKYKITPCRQELTYAVLNNPELLNEVYAASVAVRGEIDAKHHLAFAKSDMGNLDGAATILSDLGKEIQFVRILKQCEYLGSRRELDKILNLARALKMTEKNLDCSKIYNIAVLSCKRFRDVEGLQRVLAIMQQEDLYIAPDHLKYSKTAL